MLTHSTLTISNFGWVISTRKVTGAVIGVASVLLKLAFFPHLFLTSN